VDHIGDGLFKLAIYHGKTMIGSMNAFLPTLGSALGLTLLTSCASFTTEQTQTTGTNGVKVVTTKVKAKTLFDSTSELSKFRASQTEKTQSATVGSLSQEASSTNAVDLINAFARLANALPK